MIHNVRSECAWIPGWNPWSHCNQISSFAASHVALYLASVVESVVQSWSFDLQDSSAHVHEYLAWCKLLIINIPNMSASYPLYLGGTIVFAWQLPNASFWDSLFINLRTSRPMCSYPFHLFFLYLNQGRILWDSLFINFRTLRPMCSYPFHLFFLYFNQGRILTHQFDRCHGQGS